MSKERSLFSFGWLQRALWRPLPRRGVAPLPFPFPLDEDMPTGPLCGSGGYCRSVDNFVCAESARLLVNGREAFPEMLAAIESARETVDLETYMLRSDRTGGKFCAALQSAAGRGVRVRLLYDHVGSRGLPLDLVREIVAAGVEVAVYHPVALTRPTWAINRRDHRKTLVVDGLISFTGGLNLADEYAPAEEGGGDWRDTHLRLDGIEPAERLTRLFDYGWQRAMPFAAAGSRRMRLGFRLHRTWWKALHFRDRAPESPRAICPFGGVPVQVIGNQEFRHRRAIRGAYLHAIAAARHYILIESAYFIPDHVVRRALAEAVRRGVCVAVALARESDVRAAAWAGRHLYEELLDSGVRLFLWPRRMLHAKTAVIDDIWSVVGTYNLDHRSLLHQLESVAVIVDPPFARRLRDQTMDDIARCHELTLDEHNRRPLHERILESSCHFVRHWL